MIEPPCRQTYQTSDTNRSPLLFHRGWISDEVFSRQHRRASWAMLTFTIQGQNSTEVTMIESLVLIETANADEEALRSMSLSNAKQLVLGRVPSMGTVLHV